MISTYFPFHLFQYMSLFWNMYRHIHTHMCVYTYVCIYITHTHIYIIHTHTHTYIYIYRSFSHTHTHTHIYIYHTDITYIIHTPTHIYISPHVCLLIFMFRSISSSVTSAVCKYLNFFLSSLFLYIYIIYMSSTDRLFRSITTLQCG